MTKIFAINTSHGNLSLKAGYVRIAVGGYASIPVEDKDHPDFKDAYAKNWLTYSETEPSENSAAAIAPIEFFEPNRGMTAEELKADQNKTSEDTTPKATTEALGQSETTVGEATVTKLGEDTVVEQVAEPEVPVAESTPEVTEEAAEPKKGRGKKAAE